MYLEARLATNPVYLCTEAVYFLTVDPEKEIYGVFDSSYLCNAAFFYQKSDTGAKRWIKIFSRRRSDVDNKFRPSSCLIELTGILAGMLAASVELERTNKPIIISTDSKSVADLYKKLKTIGIPSQDRKINEAFAKLSYFNYEINYVSAQHISIALADIISRTPGASQSCKGCPVCDAVNSDSGSFFNSLSTISRNLGEIKFENELTPTVSYEHFLSLQKEVQNKGLNEEESYPYTENGWQNTLKPKTDLSNFSSEISLHYMARIGRKEINMSMKLNDILGDLDLMSEWQMHDKNFRVAIGCIIFF